VGAELYDTNGAAVPQIFDLFAPGAGLVLPTPGADQAQQNDNFETETETLAIFTHNQITLNDQFELTIGARYNTETKDLSADLFLENPTCDFWLNPANGAVTQGFFANGLGDFVGLSCNPAANPEHNGTYAKERDENEASGLLSLSFFATEDMMFFASYQLGYKAGGFNLDRASFDSVLFGGDGAQAEDLEFESETIDGLELGLKSSLLDNRINLNTSVFQQKLDDFQSLEFLGSNFRVFNIDETFEGLEVEVAFKATPDLLLNASFAYLKGKFDSDQDLTGTRNEGREGEDTVGTPERQSTVSATWDFAVGNMLGFAHINARYRSSFRPGGGFINTAQDATLISNLNIGLSSSNEAWQVALFVDNLTDEEGIISVFGAPLQPSTAAAYINSERRVGASLRLNF